MANPVIDSIYRDGVTYDIQDQYAERAENKTPTLRQNPDDTKFPTEKAVVEALAKKEDESNKVTAWSEKPTDKQYPSAKLVKETLDQMGEDKFDAADIVKEFGEEPSDAKVPSEKLVKDSLTTVNETIDSIRTVIVNQLPAVADAVPGVNYIVKIGNGGLMYKLIDGAFCLVGGSKVSVTEAMPESGDEFTDYYVKNTGNRYVHYRFVNGAFVPIGIDAYSKEESDQITNAKENKSNKVTAFQETPDDTHYPSEKLVKDSLDNLKQSLEGKINAIDTVTSILVDTLPAISEAKVGYDYFLKQSGHVLLYKVVDGQWKMIGGAMVSVVDELPESGDTLTDYYVPSEDGSTYLHYRWADGDGEAAGHFYPIGADSYSKEFIDEALGDIRSTHQQDKQNIDGQIQQANRNIQQNKEALDNLTGQQKTYSANLEQVGENYVFQLLEATGDADGEVVSSFQLPATGGGPSGPSSATTLVVERVTETPVIITPTDKAIIQVNFSSVDSEGEAVDASFTLKMGSTIIQQGAMVPGLNTYDVTEYCAVGSQKFVLTVTDDGNSTNVKSWTVQVVDVRMETDFSDRYTYDVGRSVNFSYTPYGSVSKTIHFKLDGVELEPVITTASGILQSYALPPQPHGAHLLECWITATVNNKNIETEHIFKDIIWYDSTSDDPVIGCIYRYDHYGNLKVRQYNAVNIPWVVYDPRTTTPTVTLKIDGALVSEEHVTNAANTWPFKSDTVALHTLTITCRNKTVTLKVEITELGYNIQPITANLEFDFNPTGLTNSSANRLWQAENNSDIKLTVSDNFDWNNGGYQVDDDGNQYFCVKSGTRAFISYNLFGVDPKRNGSEFKVIFRTTNVRDKDALFLTCLTGSENDKPGIAMYAHDAFIYTSSDTLKHPYSEEDVIEFEYNINSIDTENEDATSFILTYEDGVGARPLLFPNDEGYLLHQLTPVPITIGSDDCDVHIYRMKAYSSALTDSNILSNFIADARDSDTMIARFERNLIYNENNELTPESVAAACPDLKIIKISCPYFTNDKSNYVKNTTVECIHKNGDPALDNWTFMNGYHVGQGTTSNTYGLAGRNIDVIFGFDGEAPVLPEDKEPFDSTYVTQLTLGDGTKYTGKDGKVALTRTSVPNTWFNIKVNIASSENANNALLQRRYNEYLPYRTPGQKRNPMIKNSMEFVNCVVFVRETDPDVTKHREFSDTNWHFYAIGNLGDSKKTDNTRVNDPEDPKEFVVEISDNTMPNSTFDTGVYLNASGQITYDPKARVSTVYPISQSQWNDSRNLKRKALYEEWDESFEFRYDMGTKDGETISDAVAEAQQEESKQVFRNMYEWVVTSTDANFVSQFKNWFIEESPLYWYLFTERYTMIDNRSKNSFWHWGKTYISQAEAQEMGDDAQYYTIDDAAAAINNGYRFDLWDYDNDTALGIDNNGELNMTYGHEDTDYKVDGDPASGYIFNAADSVFWRRISSLMADKLKAMYRSREALGCWSANSLITQWDTWQEAFPEELWRLDVERKYLRPYYSGNPVAGISPSENFLKNMMNGRKRYQRRQFERDQEIYIGTKWFGTNQCSDTRSIYFRCNTPQSAAVRPDYTVRIVPYSDMYLWIAYGNSDPQGVRAKAGVEYTFETALTQMDDTQIRVYCGENIQAINDLSACYIRANDFSMAKRLKTLIIGSDVPGYDNPFITVLSIKDNALLEHLDIRNCSKLSGSLNFSGCPNLLTLLAEGTAVTGVTFAKNGKIQTAHLPASVNSLSFNNLHYLTDFSMPSYENLVTLVSEYCSMDPYDILSAAINTLQIVRILGIDWTFYATDILNKIYAMSSSFLSGKATVTGPIRNSEITNYQAKWTDLELVYDPDRIVPQFLVIYRNYDGTELGRTLVDKGSTPPDPVATGIITTIPTRDADDQYVYTYSGWADLNVAVNGEKSIYVTYSTSVRTYTVAWYLHEGEMDALQTEQVAYGSEAVYTGDIPVDTTDEASSNIYKVFKGWDKSTGYVRGNMKVYARFLETYYPDEGKELMDMNAAEVYAVSRKRESKNRYVSGDYINIRKGNDFDFDNVRSELILENRWFSGNANDYVATDIQLFKADAPSFTLAIDYEYLATNALDASLASCFDAATGDGFILGYVASSSLASTYSKITWADGQARRCGAAGRRNIIVLRHQKGSPDLRLYSFNGAPTNSNPLYYDLDMTMLLLNGPREQVTDAKLTFGAVRYEESNSTIFAKNAMGWIHWCKIWYDDLGDDNCRKLAAWPHEISRAVYVGSDRHLLGDSQVLTADAQFFDAAPLAHLMQYSVNDGNHAINTWHNSMIQKFCERRVYKGYPQEWQSAMKLVKVLTSQGANTNDVQPPSLNHIYLPAYREIINTTTYIYMREQESGLLEYFTNQAKRLMYPGFITEDRDSGVEGRRYFSQTEDPGLNGYALKDGDIWYRTNYSYIYYVYISAETAAKHSYIGARSIHDAVSSSNSNVFKAYDGGFWVNSQDWWTRSPNADYVNQFQYIYNNGSSSYQSYSGYKAILPGFSV